MYLTMSFWNKIFKSYEKPKQPPVFKPAQLKYAMKYLFMSFGIGWILLVVANFLMVNYSYIPGQESYNLGGNAIVYLIHLFLWAIPSISAGTIYNTQRCPTYGFLSLFGFMLASISFYFIASWLSIYLIICCFFLVIINIPSQGDYSVKTIHMIYYFLVGFGVSYFNCYVMIATSFAIWSYLQLLYLHTFKTTIIGLKLEPWAYAFITGWAAHALYYMIEIDLLLGIYIFFTPLIMTLSGLAYFKKIYLPMKKQGNI